MKTSNKDFGYYVSDYFTKYLSDEKGVSPHTIRSYSNCFTVFLQYMDEKHQKKSDQIEISDVTYENVIGFLSWLQDNNGISNKTWNQRAAVFRSFAKYMQYEDVIHLKQWKDIGKISMKKAEQKAINYLTIEGIKFLLAQINTSTECGERDLVMLSLLYDSAARVQELVDLTPSDLHLKQPCYVKLFGKGQKARIVPLQDNVVALLKRYIDKHGKVFDGYGRCPLFFNRSGKKLTTSGVSYILSRYVAIAHSINPDLIPENITPHCLRHSKAMHLLEADINLVYIRDILGHVSTQTTEIYARADSRKKRMVLENAYKDKNVIPVVDDTTPQWEKDSKLKSWLKSLGK